MGSYTITWNSAVDLMGQGTNPQTVVKSKMIDGDLIARVNIGRTNISGIDPIVKGVEGVLFSYLGIKSRLQYRNNNSQRNFSENMARYVMYIGECELMVSFARRRGKYNINGITANVDVLTKALSRTIIRASVLDGSEESHDLLEEYLYKCIDLPENVSYILENKLPYTFYEMTVKDTDEDRKFENVDFTLHECRMEVKQIDDESFAIELFAGVWGEISLKNLNTFINTYWKGQRRGKWSNISPEELYYKLIGDKATDSQIKVMVEFLKQNRKEDIVERRAMQLVEDMAKNYDNIKLGVYDEKKAMYVRGKITDWMIVETSQKGGIQDVATYALVVIDAPRTKCHVKTNNRKAMWNGPICIDNHQVGASVGDQFAARAFACMNDSMTVQMVSTMSSYLGNMKEGQKNCRLKWDAL